MPNLRLEGQKAEDLAAGYLLSQGFTLVTRRYAIKGGEIDLIALDGEILVFVEVRSRSGKGLTPEESVDARKRARLVRAAERYLEESRETRETRFDLVAVEGSDLRHHRDFFRPGM